MRMDAAASSADLSARLERQLRDALVAGDGTPVSDERHIALERPRRAAAVLVPITIRPEPGVILTHRPSHMRSHAGQVAFPGGKIDPEDDGPVAAALREAEEELALPRSAVSVIGSTGEYHSGSGYRIVPVLGLVAPDLPLVANPCEVEEWFEAPLSFLLDAANHVERRAMWQGRERRYLEIMWQDHRVWGVTAGIIANIAAHLGTHRFGERSA